MKRKKKRKRMPSQMKEKKWMINFYTSRALEKPNYPARGQCWSCMTYKPINLKFSNTWKPICTLSIQSSYQMKRILWCFQLGGQDA